MKMDGRTITTNLVGSYNADNVMAALCVGQQFGIGFEEACRAIEAYVPSNNRSQMTRTARNTLIIDAYNANPTSMEAALNNFAGINAKRKALMLGDMLELGTDSLAEHISVIQKAVTVGADRIFLVGKEFANAAEEMDEAGTMSFDTSTSLAEWLDDAPLEDYTILIKGSRGTKMENVVEKL